ncbi:hypothetical protein B0H14DRAFT_2584932 [Mycena olivaceomarginata]|nr:hypothetical protein B0H14DRAFT_2584932 [Mycena olivaceomarginata]
MVDCRSLMTAVCLAAVFDPDRSGPAVTLPEDAQRQMVWCTVLIDRTKKGQPKLYLEVERDSGSRRLDAVHLRHKSVANENALHPTASAAAQREVEFLSKKVKQNTIQLVTLCVACAMLRNPAVLRSTALQTTSVAV